MHPNLHIHKESDPLQTLGHYDKASRAQTEHEGTGKRAFGLAKKVHSEMQISDT